MAAYEAGVAIYAGTDAGGVLPHGLIADEVLELAAYGLHAGRRPRRRVLAGPRLARPRRHAGRGHVRRLRRLPRDPLEDLTVLREPTRVVLRGAVVA